MQTRSFWEKLRLVVVTKWGEEGSLELIDKVTYSIVLYMAKSRSSAKILKRRSIIWFSLTTAAETESTNS
jgi:hypothetical protein